MKKDSDILMMNNIKNDLSYTGIGDKPSKRKTSLLTDLLKKVAGIECRILKEEESEDLESQGVKIVTPSNIIDIYTRLEVLLGLKLSGHTDTLTEASNLIDELYRRGEIQNEQYRNALDKFRTN